MDTRPMVHDLRSFIEDLVLSAKARTETDDFWRSPLLATAEADSRFDDLGRIAAEDHLRPNDLLASAKAVIVFFIPFTRALAEDNHPGKFPCRNWGLAYESTNALINTLGEKLRDFLAQKGYQAALTPATHNFDEERLVARWSHKHLGHLVGLGRFGVNAQLITPAGCAGRLGSLVTDADLGNHALVESGELCLHKIGKECLECVKRCPVRAVSPEGVDRKRCWDRLLFTINHRENFAGLKSSTNVCGKCQVLVPCSLGIPAADF